MVEGRTIPGWVFCDSPGTQKLPMKEDSELGWAFRGQFLNPRDAGQTQYIQQQHTPYGLQASEGTVECLCRQFKCSATLSQAGVMGMGT